MTTAMTVDYYDVLESLSDAELDEDAIYERYSGRGMYGRECLGITCDVSGLVAFVAAHAVRHADDASSEATDWLKDVRSDSMGTSTIWYWPNVALGAA